MILGISLCIVTYFIGWMIYALPATFSLPPGIRPGIAVIIHYSLVEYKSLIKFVSLILTYILTINIGLLGK